MLCLLWLTVFAQAAAIDVSRVTVSPPTVVTELDLGKLKGELRQLAWSPDKTQMYVQTTEPQSGGKEKPYHYVVTVAGGALVTVAERPEWAAEYWTFKSDRSAPGIAALMIDVVQGKDTIKGLPPEGSVRGTGVGAEDLANSNSTNATSNVISLMLLGENVGRFVQTKPIPGLTFSWGPESSGAIAYVDADGKLMLLDQKKHKQTIAGVKDALLPAWTTDGARLAYVKKTGRRKYALVWSDVAR